MRVFGYELSVKSLNQKVESPKKLRGEISLVQFNSGIYCVRCNQKWLTETMTRNYDEAYESYKALIREGGIEQCDLMKYRTINICFS